MTLNTFHLAERGEMNVTLGIPRLQEILMTAANESKTPVMTCPLQKGRSKEEAQHLADKLKKITVADLVENINIRKKTTTMMVQMMVKGLKDFGLDAQKRKLQAFDEMDYEDGCEVEVRDGDLTDGDEVENDEENDIENGKDDALGVVHVIDEKSESPLEEAGDLPKPKSEEKKNKSGATIKKEVRAQLVRKETDRSIFVSANGFHFEVHFKFTDEPHILLAQIAQRTAQKVCMQRSGNVADCKQITCDENQVLLYGKDPENKQSYSSKEKKEMAALQTTGVDFRTFWKLQDVLDVRETIIREIVNVFKSYGISVNIGHLTLIADYMTHTGGYRPMNRFGGIAESISPFKKMSFETAAKFIVEAAYHGQTDDLETPSARICLGLPVKVGTGCFDLMQKIKV
ncbi:hypothetical protein ACFX19_014474 [Malus domestica]